MVIQRKDADSFAPNWTTDPDFSEALVRASENGVFIFAYRSSVNPRSISLAERVPVVLDRP